jgi:carboxyl-terminal processing protease
MIIGEPTFGKGVVQYFFRMDDGSGVKLTVAKYLTPNYHDVTLKGGIGPDLVCHDNPHGLLPNQIPDLCIKQGLRYTGHHLGAARPLLQASR